MYYTARSTEFLSNVISTFTRLFSVLPIIFNRNQLTWQPMGKISVKWHSQAYFQINPSFLTDINQFYRRPSRWAKFLLKFISTSTSSFFSCIHHFWPTSINFTKSPTNRISLNGPMSGLLSSFLIEINSFISHPPEEQDSLKYQSYFQLYLAFSFERNHSFL